MIVSYKIYWTLLFSFFWRIGFAESQDVARIYTLCQSQILSTVECEMSLRRLSGNATGFFEVVDFDLTEISDLLRNHLLSQLDLSECDSLGYQLDDVVFSFYEYYLQFIPYYEGDKKMIFINAYRRGSDKDDETDETPADHFVFVFDGGVCFWQIVYDVEGGTFSEIRINGVA